MTIFPISNVFTFFCIENYERNEPNLGRNQNDIYFMTCYMSYDLQDICHKLTGYVSHDLLDMCHMANFMSHDLQEMCHMT